MPLKNLAIDAWGSLADALVHSKIFLSSEQTGTGAEQTIPHGLGKTPVVILPFWTGDGNGAWGAFFILEGTHNSTNVLVTVTSGFKYRVLALA